MYNNLVYLLGTKAHDKLQAIKKTVLNDIQQLSPDAQTSALKGFIPHLTNGTQKCFVFHGLAHIVGKVLSSYGYDIAVHLCTVNCNGFKNEISLQSNL